MNVFVCERDPRAAAEALTDKHVVKMVLETTQVLSAVCTLKNLPNDNLYKLTHSRHPVILRSVDDVNYLRWVIDHGKSLVDEYTYRYDKTHKSKDVLLLAEKILTEHLSIPAIAIFDESWPKCVFDELRSDNLIIAYRKHLIQKYNRWEHIPKWTKRSLPSWLRKNQC